MTPSLRRRLAAERARAAQRAAELDEQFAALAESVALDPPDDEHDPEGATIGFERAQITALRDRARAQVAALDRAMERLDDATYGTCSSCGGEIGRARLLARPAVEHCIDCA